MKEKTKTMIKDNIEILNSIHNIIELFKKDSKLTTFKQSFSVYDKVHKTQKHFFISFEKNEKYKDCLNLYFDDIGSSFKEEPEFHYLSFKEVEMKDILKKFIFVLINVYGLKDSKLTQNPQLQEAQPQNPQAQNQAKTQKNEKTYY